MSYLPDGQIGEDCFTLGPGDEIPSRAQVLRLESREMSAQEVTQVFDVRFLTSASFVGCAFGFKLSELVIPPCPHIQALRLAGCGLESLPDLSFARFVQILDLSGNKIKEVAGLALAHLEELDLGENGLEKFAPGDLPELRSLRLAENRLASDEFALKTPKLEKLDLRANLVKKLKNLGGATTPGLRVLDVSENPLKIDAFGALGAAALLREIRVSPISGLTLRDIRTQALGELMSRQDEVVGAVGQNTFDDPYTRCVSADQQELLKLKREAPEMMIPPPDLTQALVVYQLGQLALYNDEPVPPEARVRLRNWICPRPTYLAMSCVKMYE